MPGVFKSRTVAVSSGLSAASDCRARRKAAAAPATDIVARKLRRVCVIVCLPHLRLQLAFELVQETPIGIFGDDLLRARLDHADFVQAKGVKADRVFGV